MLIQEELKIPYCADLAIHSNCSSIYKAIQVAGDLIANGRYRNALIMTAQSTPTSAASSARAVRTISSLLSGAVSRRNLRLRCAERVSPQ